MAKKFNFASEKELEDYLKLFNNHICGSFRS